MKNNSKGEFQVTRNAAAKTPKQSRRKAEPVVSVKAHPAVVETANALARGRDVHLEVQRDGSIVVRNGK